MHNLDPFTNIVKYLKGLFSFCFNMCLLNDGRRIEAESLRFKIGCTCTTKMLVLLTAIQKKTCNLRRSKSPELNIYSILVIKET
jgi:hypothetical protein